MKQSHILQKQPYQKNVGIQYSNRNKFKKNNLEKENFEE